MAAPTIPAGHTVGNSGGGSSDYTLTAPTNIAGDIIYLAIVEDDVGLVMSCTGFSKLYSEVDISGSATFTLFYKTSSGSEPANYTVTTTVSERAAWMTFAVRGAGSTTPNVQATNATGSGTTATVN